MKGRVLIADDESGTIESLRLILEKLEFQVEKAIDGANAYELIKSNEYDFAFLDINMPEMTGIELVKKIKYFCPTTIIVIITGYGSMNKDFALSTGAHEYIEKPFSEREIENVVRKYKAI